MNATPDLNILTDLIERQAKTTAALTRARNFAEISGIMAQTMLTGDGQFVSINLADYDIDGALIRIRSVASANREEVFETEFGC